MFRRLLEKGVKMRYASDTLVEHFVEPLRLKRSYFLKLYRSAGVPHCRYSRQGYFRRLFGIPPFMLVQTVAHSAKALGMIHGTRQRWLEGRKK